MPKQFYLVCCDPAASAFGVWRIVTLQSIQDTRQCMCGWHNNRIRARNHLLIHFGSVASRIIVAPVSSFNFVEIFIFDWAASCIAQTCYFRLRVIIIFRAQSMWVDISGKVFAMLLLPTTFKFLVNHGLILATNSSGEGQRIASQSICIPLMAIPGGTTSYPDAIKMANKAQ